MTVTLEWPQILLLLTVFAGLLRMLVFGKIKDLEARQAEDRKNIVNLQENVAALKAEIPTLYERREDAMRAYTVINAKLDKLYELLAGR